MSYRSNRKAMGLFAGLVIAAATTGARATFEPPQPPQQDYDILFCETFDGYDDIFNNHQNIDEKSYGLPKPTAWGGHSDELWYGVRFEQPDSGSINDDLAVQEIGGSGNWTPVGRFEDESGLMFKVDTRGYESVVLCFDWRTFAAESGDKLRAGYIVGDIGANTNPTQMSDLFVDFNALLPDASQWWDDDWTKIVPGGRNDNFTSVTFDLPVGEECVWVAFWLDGSEGDYGKIDNVKVKGVVPEPASLALIGLGAVTLLSRRRNHR